MTKKALITAVSAACVQGDKILLVLRGRAPSKGLHAFPGGRVEPGEALDAAVQRELAEETGLEAVRFEPFRTVELAREEPGPPVYTLTVFLVHEVRGQLAAGDDAADAGWFTLAEAEKIPITPSTLAVVRELLQAAGG